MVVGTWNLENLFRPGGDVGPPDEPSYDAKLEELARVIGEIEPDVLAVQEIGDPDALEDLAWAPWRRLARRDLGVSGRPRNPGRISVAARVH